MKYITKLLPKQVRPVINLYGIRCLIDTGATTPVWCGNNALFESVFSFKEPVGFMNVSGFGGSGTSYEVYRINDFTLIFSEKPIVYKVFYILKGDMYRKNFDMILPATVFVKMAYTVDNSKHTFQLEYDHKLDGFTMLISRDINMRSKIHSVFCCYMDESERS